MRQRCSTHPYFKTRKNRNGGRPVCSFCFRQNLATPPVCIVRERLRLRVTVALPMSLAKTFLGGQLGNRNSYGHCWP